MGKRIIQRARGKGGPRYRSPSHRYAGKISYPRKGLFKVADLIHDPGRNAPLAKIISENREMLIIAPEGIRVGDIFEAGKEPIMGNIVPLSKIPKGEFAFAFENVPGSGPKLCCAPGTKGIIIAQEKSRTLVQMPSKKIKSFNPNCFATVGIPAGSGRKIKRMMNAGQKYFAMQARNRLWPRSSAVKMNAVDHPFGGRTKPGTPKTISRHAPPGAKVGTIASRRTGTRKK